MPTLEQRGPGVALKDNNDRVVAFFPQPVGDVMIGPYGDAIKMRAEGLLAQTAPRQQGLSSASTGGGTTRLVLLFLPAGITLSNGWIAVGTNGTGVTLAKVGIYRPSDGKLLASTADFSAGVNAGSTPRAAGGAFVTPWTAPGDGAYYAGVLQVGGTPASVLLSGSQAAGSFAFAGGSHPSPSVTSQTDLVDVNPASFAGGSTIPWIGFS